MSQTQLSFFFNAVNNDYYIVWFMVYPDLNLVMNSIRILNNNDISLLFGILWLILYSFLE